MLNLEGTWYNELGSTMTLEVNGRSIIGKYITAVGEARGTYDLVGRTDTDFDSSKNVGFVVSWENEYGSSDSVTSWSGQLQHIDGEDIIITTWLLTHETDPSSTWKDTIIDKDIFKRTKPLSEEIKRKLKYKSMSHPLNFKKSKT